MEQQPFIDRHWLYYNPLRRDTVLTYFAQSRFYDRASCNEELRMQGATVGTSILSRPALLLGCPALPNHSPTYPHTTRTTKPTRPQPRTPTCASTSRA